MAGQMTLLIAGMGALGPRRRPSRRASLTAAQRSLLAERATLVQSLNTAYNDLRSGKGLLGGWSSRVDHITDHGLVLHGSPREDPGRPAARARPAWASARPRSASWT